MPFSYMITCSVRKGYVAGLFQHIILAIAGGIGITPILGYLQLHLSEIEKGARRRPGRFILFWTAREEILISAVRIQIGDIETLKGKDWRLGLCVQGLGMERG
jgi:hypothetical protein